MSEEEFEPATEELEGIARFGFGSEGSLRDRMRHRAAEMERNTTERFPVPGYADVLQVELTTLGWEDVRRVTDRHQRQRDTGTRDLYVAADTIIETTVSFWEVDDAGHRERVDTSWVALAASVVHRFPDDGTPRQAVLALLQPTARVISLWNDWGEWNLAERSVVGEELSEDFSRTR
jgi:hypothetical protein